MPGRASDRRRVFFHFNTPLPVFLTVVVPICLLMAPLAVVASRGWIRATAALVVACSVYAGARGYGCRLVVDDEGVTYRALWRSRRLAWRQVRGLGRYSPGPSGAPHIFITLREHPPAGRWDVGDDTIQIQDRPGLLEALEAARRAVEGESKMG